MRSRTQPADASDVCPICRDTPRDIFITSCGHAFCGSCISRYLFFCATSHGGRACPACRQTVICCTSTTTTTAINSGAPGTGTPPGALERLASFQLGKVLLKIDIPDDKPLDRLSRLFKTPASKLKFIHRGHVLHGSTEVMRAAASSKVPITLLPQATMHRLPTVRVLLYYIRLMLLTAWSCLLRCTAPARRVVRPWLTACYKACQPWFRALHALVMSTNPEWAGGTEARSQQAPQQPPYG